MTPESWIKAEVDRALATLPHCYKFKPVQNGMGAPGLDYYCCIGSRFIAIETKAPGKKLTPRQRITASNIVNAGGAVYVIRNGVDIIVFLNEIKYAPHAASVYDACL